MIFYLHVLRQWFFIAAENAGVRSCYFNHSVINTDDNNTSLPDWYTDIFSLNILKSFNSDLQILFSETIQNEPLLW